MTYAGCPMGDIGGFGYLGWIAGIIVLAMIFAAIFWGVYYLLRKAEKGKK